MKTRSDKKATTKDTGKVKFIKAASGNTYRCPTSALDKIDTNNEADLKRVCINEPVHPRKT